MMHHEGVVSPTIVILLSLYFLLPYYMTRIYIAYAVIECSLLLALINLCHCLYA